MDKEYKQAERQQYFHYFRFWFLAVAILLVIALIKFIAQLLVVDARTNQEAPAERVYDYAEVLTAEEEENLRQHIAQCEQNVKVDIVLVTVNEYMGESDADWENAMMVYADDFYDEHDYGYDQARGNGVLLLDNWQEGQKGSWLSTCGTVLERFGDYEVNQVLRKVYDRVDDDPYEAYKAYIDEVTERMDSEVVPEIPFGYFMFLALLVAFIYAMVLKKPFKQDTYIGANTYVNGGKPVMRHRADNLRHKSVSTVRISSSSGGSGGSGGGGGGGGSHSSSSGTSHGGGGMRR